MKKERAKADMRAEYDFSKGVRGKYSTRYAEGTNVVVLDSDVLEVFPDSQSVNSALRTMMRILRARPSTMRRTTRAPRRTS